MLSTHSSDSLSYIMHGLSLFWFFTSIIFVLERERERVAGEKERDRETAETKKLRFNKEAKK